MSPGQSFWGQLPVRTKAPNNPQIADNFSVLLTAVNTYRYEAKVNGKHVGYFSIETRIVPVGFTDYSGEETRHYKENREVTRLFFRSARDAFKRGSVDIAPGSTMSENYVQRQLRKLLHWAVMAYVVFYGPHEGEITFFEPGPVD